MKFMMETEHSWLCFMLIFIRARENGAAPGWVNIKISGRKTAAIRARM